MKHIYILFIFALFTFSCHSQTSNTKYNSKGCKYYYDEDLQKNIYMIADIKPEYPDGGDSGFLSFLSKDYILSKEEIMESFADMGRVSIKLFIDKDGEILSYYILDMNMNDKPKEKFTKAEQCIVQNILKSPKWNPAKCNNRNVAYLYILHYSTPRLK